MSPASQPALLKPRALRPGDVVAVIAPATPHDNRSEIERGVAMLQSWGYRVSLGEHVQAKRGYLAGNDAQRATDFNAAFSNPEVRAVWCFRGGYGSARLLPLLDFEALRRDPKIFVGYSDITALHVAIYQRTGLVTFYGPMTRGLHRITPFTRSHLFAALTGDGLATNRHRAVQPSPDDPWVQTITPGTARGPLVGGCLSLLAQGLGTPDEIDTTGKIVLLEDVNEEPYRIDAYLTQLNAAGKLRRAAGIVIGEMVRCGPREYEPAFTSTLSLEEVFDDHIGALGVPTIYGLPLGHGRHLFTIPLGVSARLDAHHGQLWLEEEGIQIPS